jgi:methyl-accepting chemotaxis protein
MFQKMSLAKKINASLALIALIFLSTTIFFFYNDEKVLAEHFVERNLESLAINYFDSVNTMMLTGTIANRKIIQDKIVSQDDIVEARILRAAALNNVFGPGNSDQSAQSACSSPLSWRQAYQRLVR